MFYRENLIPFYGTQTFKLYDNIDDVKMVLDSYKIGYTIENWNSDYETVKNPWQIIVIANIMSLFFASNGKLFKIVVWDQYTGPLPNGIEIGMDIADAQKIDSSLQYDDWNEDYESSEGYWVEDDIETGKIISISIFIKEVLDEDTFDYCNW